MSLLTLIDLFFATSFFVNSIPHFVSGISGRKFPTPFAKPSGIGLSSALVNTFWGFSNILVGFILLFLIGPITLGFNIETLLILCTILLVSALTSKHFGDLKLK